ncbi:phytoene/squalene synthase family protein [Amycolatopsis alkalitolerans]|uniref:Phytoene/squalene synthase family protein n=1 Tax=Amycolatopsis alkalitolerans TaxID=2547244 RepID=A0A5C4M456_9PSEU|nr:phytoene/squalene synthase family protein [Amycolatopsis alkalitolerans]TNC24837.1 phytoene/squalene synthase family protein [Amycolatopsis alkalitolerans]
MSRRELAAARITDPRLHEAYLRCRALNARHGRTYFLATRLLRPRQRPAIHALYGFARYTDDIVDHPQPGTDASARLTRVQDELSEGLRTGRSAHPVLAAVVDTTRRFGIDPAFHTAFLASMRMDLTVTGYPDRASLRRYVHGSAEVIGLQLLPVLGTVVDPAEAAPHAAALGEAFQLTNFLRDIAEDLDRGRVYLPEDELAAYGVDRGLLMWCRRAGRVEPRVRRALADQIAFTRAVYRRARPGIRMLDPASRPCVATAFALYARILDHIEDQEYNVFGTRVKVGNPKRLALAGGAAARALWARAAG